MYDGLIYKSSIRHNDENKFYFSSTANTWKTRFIIIRWTLPTRNMQMLQRFQNSPGILKQVVNWHFVAKITQFFGRGEQCNMCLPEKRFILKNVNNINLLNKQTLRIFYSWIIILYKCRFQMLYFMIYIDYPL